MKVIQAIFFNNYLLMLPVLSWLIAQILKTIIDYAINGKFQRDRLYGSGGMPSSHSSTVCALFVGAAKEYGVSSPIFALSFVFALVVMYDAMGVRLETGKQAKILNRILEDLNEHKLSSLTEPERLKEMVGHTPFQVVAGAVLGIVIGLVIPVF